MDELTETHEPAKDSPQAPEPAKAPAEEKAADAFDHEAHLLANGFRKIRDAWRR